MTSLVALIVLSGGALIITQQNTICVAHGALPDPRCTPGQALPGVTSAQICTAGYATKARDVPQKTKDQVYVEYGVKTHKLGQYEIDHLISIELGGSNDISNLWPEPALPVPGFHEKDRVEDWLHAQVCSGAMQLSDAQKVIATDWLSVYNGLQKNSEAFEWIYQSNIIRQ